MNVWFEDCNMGFPLKNSLTHCSISSFTSGHNFLKNSVVNLSSPGDLPVLKAKSVDLISSSSGCCVSHAFMSGETTLGNTIGMGGRGVVGALYRSVK